MLTTYGGENVSIPCLLYHNVTPAIVIPHMYLNCGTSLERKAPESLTQLEGPFVHGQM